MFMVEMGNLTQEQMRTLCLDTRNRVQKNHLVYQGSLNASMIRVGEMFLEPLRLNRASILLVHNHPSGDPTPSPEDVLVTREIVSAGKLLDIEVLDHLVIGQGVWVSMREKVRILRKRIGFGRLQFTIGRVLHRGASLLLHLHDFPTCRREADRA
jgi:DNA repair protein RadC